MVSRCSVGYCSLFVFNMVGMPGGGLCGLDFFVLLLLGQS